MTTLAEALQELSVQTDDILLALRSAISKARWLTAAGGAFYSAEEHRWSLIAQLEWARLALGDSEASEALVKDAEYRSHHQGKPND